MGKSITVILNDQKILSELCGVNDTNLRIMEKLLNEKIYSRGNELLIETENAEKRELFKRIINQLKDHTEMGNIPGPDLIKAVIKSTENGEDEKTELIKKVSIVIPGGNIKVFPRSYNQADYMKAMEENDVVFCIGPAGTGKTYLAVAHALKETLSRSKRKLLLTRPVVEAGESLGYLPGDLAQKISPYLRPLSDAMEELLPAEVIARMEETRIIEIAPLAYMRGRSLRNSYIILDEAQNTTKEQMKMFLTRLGEGSKAVITGDITQIDLPKKDHSGLLHVVKILGNIRGIQFSYLSAHDVVRHPLVQEIIHAYENRCD